MMFPDARKRWIIRSAAIAGTVAPVLFWSLVVVGDQLRPNYDPIGQYISELALGRYGWVQTLNFIATGCLLMLFPVGLHLGIHGGAGSRLAPGLILAAGFGFVVLGIFARDPPGAPRTLIGEIHRFVSYVLIALPVASLALAADMRRDPRWRRWTWFSILAGVIPLLLLHGYIAATQRYLSLPAMGLYQRILVGVPCLWLEVVAVRLFVLSLESVPGASCPALPDE